MSPEFLSREQQTRIREICRYMAENGHETTPSQFFEWALHFVTEIEDDFPDKDWEPGEYEAEVMRRLGISEGG